MDSLTAGEDYQADIRRCIGLDIVEVNFHELVALLNLLALFHEHFKALTAQFYRIHAEVNQEFRTVSCLHANGMLRVKHKHNFGITGSDHRTISRSNEEAIAHHLAGKSCIRSFRDGMRRTSYRCVEFMVTMNSNRCLFLHSSFFHYRSFCTCFHFRSRYQIFFQIGLNHSNLRAINDLYARALDDNAGSTGGLQKFLVNQFRISYRAAQTGCTTVNRSDVALAAQSPGNRPGVLKLNFLFKKENAM